MIHDSLLNFHGVFLDTLYIISILTVTIWYNKLTETAFRSS